MSQGCPVWNPENVSFLKSWKDELQHKITNHVKAKTGELVVSPFILGKVQETQRSVLHKPRDSFYNVTIQYIIAYILDNRKLYTHPSSGALALFLGPKGAPCLLCMLALHVAALLQGRTCTAASCRVWGGNLAKFLALVWRHSFSDRGVMPQPNACVYLKK